MAQYKRYSILTRCRHCGGQSRQFDLEGYCSERCKTRTEVTRWVERFHELEAMVEKLTTQVTQLEAENEALKAENERLR